MPPKKRKAPTKTTRQTRLTDAFTVIGGKSKRDLEPIDKDREELRKRLKRVTSEEPIPIVTSPTKEEEIPEHVKPYLEESSRQKLIDLLKSFDLDANFGPCIGLTRLERWNRAKTLSLNPPQLVHDILSLNIVEKDEELREALWHNLVTQPVDPEDEK